MGFEGGCRFVRGLKVCDFEAIGIRIDIGSRILDDPDFLLSECDALPQLAEKLLRVTVCAARQKPAASITRTRQLDQATHGIPWLILIFKRLPSWITSFRYFCNQVVLVKFLQLNSAST